LRVRARSGAERHPEDFMSSSRAKLGAGRGKAAVALTIAGSDSGGGAGIQADLKTFEAFGVFGTCAVTCVTAQNPDRVAAVEPISPRIVREQIRAVCSAFPVAAAKTGMLYSAAIIREVAGEIRRNTVPWLVVDPVMISTSGARLLRKDAMRALLDCLAPVASVLTPNITEAEALLGERITSESDLVEAAVSLSRMLGCAVVVKGGHLRGRLAVDAFSADGLSVRRYYTRRITAAQTHGTGCTFAAALTAALAIGIPLEDSVFIAKSFVQSALRGAMRIGRHSPLGWRAAGAGLD